MEVCAEAADGQQAVAQSAKTAPDIVLLDLKMPGVGGFEALRLIKAQSPTVKVLVLSMYDDESYLRKVLEAGASGYVLKRAADVELLSAIRSVYEGGVYVDPSLSRLMVKGFLSAKPNGAKAADGKAEEPALSERQRQVLRLLAYGYTSKQIAEEICLSVKTVEGYRARIMEKYGLRSRAALTRYAMEKGLLDDEPKQPYPL